MAKLHVCGNIAVDTVSAFVYHLSGICSALETCVQGQQHACGWETPDSSGTSQWRDEKVKMCLRRRWQTVYGDGGLVAVKHSRPSLFACCLGAFSHSSYFDQQQNRYLSCDRALKRLNYRACDHICKHPCWLQQRAERFVQWVDLQHCQSHDCAIPASTACQSTCEDVKPTLTFTVSTMVMLCQK